MTPAGAGGVSSIFARNRLQTGPACPHHRGMFPGNISISRTSIAAAALVMLLFVAVIGFEPLRESRSPGTLSGDGDATRQIAYLLILCTVFAIGLGSGAARRLLAIPLPLAIAMGWCWLSVSWSAVPEIALRRLALTTIIVWIIFRLVDELGFRSTVAWVAGFLIVLLPLNYLAVLFSPVGVHSLREVGDLNIIGNWRGLLPHKNFAGIICASTILFVLLGLRGHLAARIVVALAAALFLYYSHSKTSTGVVLIALAAGYLFLVYNPAYRMLLVPGIMILAVSVAFAFERGLLRLSNPIYEPNSLTGRGELWMVVTRYINDNPLLGTGFGSFWNIGESSPVYQYSTSWVTHQANAHNGYLDLAAQIGVPGLILTVVAVFVVPLARVLASTRIPRRDGALVVALLVFFLCHNMTESSLLDRDMIGQIFVILAVALAEVSTRRRATRPTEEEVEEEALDIDALQPADPRERGGALGGAGV